MGAGLNIAIAEKRFPGSEAPLFSDFSLAVGPGEVVALVGPSGVGKSTLLRMVAAVDRDFSGRIEIDGRAAGEGPPAGFVFQDARLLPWLTAIDNIRAVRRETTRAQALDLLARVGLADRGEAFPRQLSGGMQRRVALARALSVNPQLLLLDEPFVSLDRRLVSELQQLVIDIAEATGATIVLVSHMAEDAAVLADRAVALAGRPARIAADLAIETPRRQRDPAMLMDLSAEIARG